MIREETKKRFSEMLRSICPSVLWLDSGTVNILYRFSRSATGTLLLSCFIRNQLLEIQAEFLTVFANCYKAIESCEKNWRTRLSLGWTSALLSPYQHCEIERREQGHGRLHSFQTESPLPLQMADRCSEAQAVV